MSAFLGPDQAATEALLATDPEVLPWVQKYQRSRETVSETDYEVSVSTKLKPLSYLYIAFLYSYCSLGICCSSGGSDNHSHQIKLLWPTNQL